MPLYDYHILKFKDVTPRDLHGKKYLLKAEVVPTDKRGTPEEKSVTIKIEFKVTLQSSRLYGWKKNNPALEEQESMRKVLYKFGQEYLKQKLRAGVFGEITDLMLHNKNVPSFCPYDPEGIEIDLKICHEVEVHRPIGFDLNF